MVLITAIVVLRAWLSYSWQERTIRQFLGFARICDFAACRAMLKEDRSDEYVLDDLALRLVAREPLQREPFSFADFVRGRGRFHFYLAYSNDHSITVEGGRVILGGAFWHGASSLTGPAGVEMPTAETDCGDPTALQ